MLTTQFNEQKKLSKKSSTAFLFCYINTKKRGACHLEAYSFQEFIEKTKMKKDLINSGVIKY